MFAYLFSPDLVTAGGVLLGAAGLFAVYHLTGHLRRRPGPLVTVPGPRVGPEEDDEDDLDDTVDLGDPGAVARPRVTAGPLAEGTPVVVSGVYCVVVTDRVYHVGDDSMRKVLVRWPALSKSWVDGEGVRPV